MSRLFLASLFLLASLALEAKGDPPPANDARPWRVLFVGNSYTYTNDLPRVVQQLSAVHGREIVSSMLASPNFAISDHFGNGVYQSVVSRGYDWVILQQGPSSLPENREHLAFWSKRAADIARGYGSRVALFSAWPALQNDFTWLAAERSYHEAAEFSQTCVLPVATAWRFSRERMAGVELYQDDLLHPTEAGTLLAAMTILRGLDFGAFVEATPDAASALDEDWSAAAGHAAAFDRIVSDALANESNRCWQGK
jgi:hypothetical protein